MKETLTAAGLDLRHVVFVNPYVTEKTAGVMNRVYAKHFEFGNTPARATTADPAGLGSGQLRGRGGGDRRARPLRGTRRGSPAETASARRSDGVRAAAWPDHVAPASLGRRLVGVEPPAGRCDGYAGGSPWPAGRLPLGIARR